MKTRTHVFYAVNTMHGRWWPATQGAGASAATVLTLFPRNIPALVSEGLIQKHNNMQSKRNCSMLTMQLSVLQLPVDKNW